ncbi:CDPK-related kinase 3-like, partial [Trifolium medium]|nr:CDPK-related kinase 3-like [Trifolium medium]
GVEADSQSLDKSFGYSKNFGAKYELGKEVGRGHFGHTCAARAKKGDLKDQPVAVKIISKSKESMRFLGYCYLSCGFPMLCSYNALFVTGN